jgi:hypothetical protein
MSGIKEDSLCFSMTFLSLKDGMSAPIAGIEWRMYFYPLNFPSIKIWVR